METIQFKLIDFAKEEREEVEEKKNSNTRKCLRTPYSANTFDQILEYEWIWQKKKFRLILILRFIRQNVLHN